MDRRLRQIALFGLLAVLIGTSGATAQGLAVDPANSGDTAILRALDKITTRHTDLEAPVGGSAYFGALEIRVAYCRARPPEEPPETFVLLTVIDRTVAAGRSPVVFDGWMLASVPGLNPLEHPVYGLWVIGCHMPNRTPGSKNSGGNGDGNAAPDETGDGADDG